MLILVLNLVLLTMVELVWILGKPTYTTRKFILIQTCAMGDFGHIGLTTHHPSFCNLGVGIPNLENASGYSFGVDDGDGRGDVGPRNDQIHSHKVDYCTDGGNA